jgi:hypothetical protein
MTLKLINQLVKTDEEIFYGRLRTYKFLESRFFQCCPDLPMKLVPTPIWFMPPSMGWSFIEKNRLQWVIDSDDDEGIINEFLRLSLSKNIRKGLKTFLQNRLPGPVVVEGLFSGEDMGIIPPLDLFRKKYIMDPSIDITERVDILEKTIKMIWAEVFTQSSKLFMRNLEFPIDNWMVSISVTEPSAPRRGSFYYPDISSVIWGGGTMKYHGFATGGWWEPNHKDFSTPVFFTPGEEIGPGPKHLLAMEAKPGKRPLTKISRHLAKTHGTMNLTIVDSEKKDQSKGENDEARCSNIAGKNSPFTLMTARLIDEVSSILGEPITMNLTLQPNNYTGESEVFINSIRTFIPNKFSKVMPKPHKNNVQYLWNNIPTTGHGSGFIRYLISLHTSPDSATINKINKLLNSLSFVGESVMFCFSKEIDIDMVKKLSSHDSVIGVCSPYKIPMEKHTLFNISVPFNVKNLDQLIDTKMIPGVKTYMSPKSVKVIAENKMGMAWV